MFESLSNEVDFYKCNNFVHVAKYCKLNTLPRDPKNEPNIPLKYLQDYERRRMKIVGFR